MADNNARGKQDGGRRGKNARRNDRGGGQRRAESGRKEWSRNRVDKRRRNDEDQAAKRRRFEATGEQSTAVWETQFTEQEIQAEERRPKRKVAVLIGYAGTGYKGMQIMNNEKTIEGDIFAALVQAGAISKANANDPKKSSFVRCARTDKGVHAAGNVISLKLIVEDPDIVAKINNHLPPQIRVWGFERTNNSFSCYQACDSRWYEYLIPTSAFLPPHPRSYLGRQLEESAAAEGKYDEYRARQEDVAGFWDEAEKTHIAPVMDKMDPEMRDAVQAALFVDRETFGEEAAETLQPPAAATLDGQPTSTSDDTSRNPDGKKSLTPLELAIKDAKAAYVAAKKAYRISTVRQKRVQAALEQYVGTINFHNYTILKRHNDPSAMRYIRSFKTAEKPIIIGDTEWLSMKVHGQSFMMHQIRKMVGMAALVVRCGSPLSIMKDSFGEQTISIPKAPGLGLLLERPVFDSYNERAVGEFEREKIDFDKFATEMNEFKQQQIYSRIFEVERQENKFHAFFNHLDWFKSDFFLWVTAAGIKATRQAKAKDAKMAQSVLHDESDEEVDANGEEG